MSTMCRFLRRRAYIGNLGNLDVFWGETPDIAKDYKNNQGCQPSILLATLISFWQCCLRVFYQCFFVFHGLNTDKTIADTSKTTWSNPNQKFNCIDERYFPSSKAAPPWCPEMSFMAVSQGPRKNVPDSMPKTVIPHLTISHLCRKNPQFVNVE